MLSTLKPENIKPFINKIDGNFSIILENKNFFLGLVDRICSYPLIYTNVKNVIHISENGSNLKEKLKPKELSLL